VNFYRKVFKRAADFVGALLLLLVLSPFITGVLFAVWIANKGQVFFLQERPGLHAKSFRIIKFKTMRDAWDAKGNPLPDEVRLTQVGKMIRSASLDELLQLINVLKGDMSLVGPRPLLVQYLPRYTKEQARRHEVKPGITGWAQVNGRNAISWEEKFILDLEYLDRQSFALDLKILYLTLIKVFKREGISANGEATMSEFRGSSAVGKAES
jgi:lipopolysaccharide/colanic/teichoic acid biosynthesis glycosyltransferase